MHTYSSHTHTYKHTHRYISTHTNTYKHIYEHIQTHMHTYKHMHAAIRKNGREELVFSRGRTGGATKQTEQKHIWYTLLQLAPEPENGFHILQYDRTGTNMFYEWSLKKRCIR